MSDQGGDEPRRPQRAVTMQDVADHVGVSRALVSMVFRRVQGPSAETRQRVLDAAEKLGYRPNRSAALLSLRRSHLIGVMANIRNTFHAEMVEYMVGEADSFGYEVVLGAVTPTHGESAVVETLLDFRCEALILLGPEFDDSDRPPWRPGRRWWWSAGAPHARRSTSSARPTPAASVRSSITSLRWGIGGSRTSAAAADPSRRTARLDTYVP